MLEQAQRPMSIQYNIANLKDAFPSYFHPLFSLLSTPHILNNFFIISGLIILILITAIFIISYIRIKRFLSGSYTILEVKPTYKTLQSAFSTEQLFAVVHSLEQPISLFERLIGLKHIIGCELVSTKKTGIRYILRIPYEDITSIKKSLLAYLPGVEIQETTDYLPSHIENIPSDKYFSMREFILKKPYVLPLKNQSVLKEYDPIAYITSHMTKLDVDELVALQFICTPVVSRTHGSVFTHTHKLNEKLLSDKDISRLIYGCKK